MVAAERVAPGASAGTQAKRWRIPRWLWITVAAVLLLFFLLVGGAAWAVAKIRGMTDPVVQWRQIREVIAVDDPLPGYDVLGLPAMDGMRGWFISDDVDDWHVVLFHARGEEADGLRVEMLGKLLDSSAPAVEGTIVVQGRELRCARGHYTDSTTRGTDRSGPAIVVDLSREGSDEFLICMKVLHGLTGTIEDALAIEFLKPFHVGPER